MTASRRALLAAALAVPAAGAAMGQTAEWPPRQVRIIVPFPAGRVTDLVARIVADGLREGHGTTVVVENRPGANATIGMDLVKRAAPDGATLMVGGLGSHGIPPVVIPNFPFDVHADFTALAIMAEFVNVMVVPADSPARTVQEFLALARARPGALNYGFTSVGASNQLTAELFNQRGDVSIQGVPLGQQGNSLVMLQRGDVQVAFENLPSVAGAIRGGTLRALAVTSAERTPQLPDVPTLQEQGLADFVVTSWIGIYGPPAMPPALVTRIAEDLRRIGADPEARRRLTAAGFEPAFRGPAEFAAFQRREVERWGQVVRRAGLSLQP
ncbi:tripartite tricarboxylate transporter substrate binding protein [Roseomonas sp. CAU 1739]|uniref:Bug family tripartite tricarboxylate transporter substrate binding protein n=1 Tax=Roseomonas sp. CAU 1739 TaxID=3140364 RepID=UPI00325B2760